MQLSKRERVRRDDFAAAYRLGIDPAMRAVERAVCGCDYGATSWATREEADRIGGILRLGPGTRLLEVGAGSGWPALYLAKVSGCDAFLTDLPQNALEIAMDRVAADPLVGRCHAIVADGATLPFGDAGFDAVNHSDVLCCLPRKRRVLAECRRVVARGGVMAFSVIDIPPGLPAEAHAEALETAPDFVDCEPGYAALLAETGWAVRDRQDLSGSFASACGQLLRARQARRSELAGLLGENEFERQQARMGRRISVLERGWLSRDLYVAEPA